jgi:acetyl esterase
VSSEGLPERVRPGKRTSSSYPFEVPPEGDLDQPALAEPHAFPGGHDLTGFPPTLLLDADHDSMRASGGRFAEELAAARVGVDYHVIADTDHAFLNRPNDPGFAVGLRLIAEWSRRV